MMKRTYAVLLLSLATAASIHAATPNAMRKTAEATMLVTGKVTVAPDGSLASYVLDRQERIPPNVVDLIHTTVAGWHFKLERAQSTTASMSIRMLAKPDGNGNFLISMSSAHFGDASSSDEIHMQKGDLPPRYPADAIRSRVSGTAFLVLRVGRDGKVADASVEQVNLRVVDFEDRMAHWRDDLGEAAITAAKSWTFAVPTTGKFANAADFVTRVPVSYDLNPVGTSPDKYGHWEIYIPGPKATPAWLVQRQPSLPTDASGDALPDGGAYLVGGGLTLDTPLAKS